MAQSLEKVISQQLAASPAIRQPFGNGFRIAFRPRGFGNNQLFSVIAHQLSLHDIVTTAEELRRCIVCYLLSNQEAEHGKTDLFVDHRSGDNNKLARLMFSEQDDSVVLRATAELLRMKIWIIRGSESKIIVPQSGYHPGDRLECLVIGCDQPMGGHKVQYVSLLPDEAYTSVHQNLNKIQAATTTMSSDHKTAPVLKLAEPPQIKADPDSENGIRTGIQIKTFNFRVYCRETIKSIREDRMKYGTPLTLISVIRQSCTLPELDDVTAPAESDVELIPVDKHDQQHQHAAKFLEACIQLAKIIYSSRAAFSAVFIIWFSFPLHRCGPSWLDLLDQCMNNAVSSNATATDMKKMFDRPHIVLAAALMITLQTISTFVSCLVWIQRIHTVQKKAHGQGDNLLVQCIKGFSFHHRLVIKILFNLISLAACIAFFLTRSPVSIAAVLLTGWWEVVHRLLFIKSVFYLDMTMRKILDAMFGYAVVYGVILLGTACALCVLGADTSIFMPDMTTAHLSNTIMKLFTNGDMYGNFHAIENCTFHQDSNWLTINADRFTFNFYVVAVVVICVNLVVANITSTHDEEVKAMEYEKAMIICCLDFGEALRACSKCLNKTKSRSCPCPHGKCKFECQSCQHSSVDLKILLAEIALVYCECGADKKSNPQLVSQ